MFCEFCSHANLRPNKRFHGSPLGKTWDDLGDVLARINIDDDIESKPQFWRLLPLVEGDRDKALGKLVRLFRMAQAYYGRGKSIPGAELEAEELECMIDSGWVECTDPLPHSGKDLSELSFMVPSPEKHFAWHLQRKQAAKIGGHARGNAPRDESGRFLPNGQAKPADAQPDAGETQPTSTPHAHAHAHKEIHVDSESTHAPPSPYWLAARWNEHCGSLPKIRNPERLNGKRLIAAKARLKEHPYGADWLEAIRRMAASPFCQGKNNKPGEHHGWRADFDFLLQPGRLDQALEGKWDAKGSVGTLSAFARQQQERGA